jgi:alkanesulfonate monooxygenase SsuD/methylene tetrahydromethanopterin reductase-like flavin-dependent oxidoreductase (luciferase family)
MRVGVGLPNAMQGVDRDSIITWARAAEDAGFSSLAAVDRLTFINYEPLMTLAAVAAVTESIELLTDIVLAPLHVNAAMLAKQAATLDRLSGGRLALGLGVGGNPEDFEVSGLDYQTRGRVFEDQLKLLRAFWKGTPVGPISGEAVGPTPYDGRRLPILIGGHADPAFRRAAEYGDGWASADRPERFLEGAEKMRAAWAVAGRNGAPRLTATLYFSLGEVSRGVADRNLSRFYNATSPRSQQWVLQTVARDADAVLETIAAYQQAGADDVICLPTATDPTELGRLAEIAL